MSGQSTQVPNASPSRYVLETPPSDEPDVCRFCGTDIVRIDTRWYALEARWPNLAHCHYSARSGASIGHEPVQPDAR